MKPDLSDDARPAEPPRAPALDDPGLPWSLPPSTPRPASPQPQGASSGAVRSVDASHAAELPPAASAAPDEPSALPHEPSASPLIGSRADFHAALRAGLEEAQDAGVTTLWLIDRDFADWPLGERAIVERLQAWITSRRQLQLLALDYRDLAERAPRWVAWRRTWAHAVNCFEIHPELAGEVPSLMLLPGRLAVRLFDRERHRGSVERTAVELVRCRELVDALSQRASPAFPVTTLGL